MNTNEKKKRKVIESNHTHTMTQASRVSPGCAAMNGYYVHQLSGRKDDYKCLHCSQFGVPEAETDLFPSKAHGKQGE